MKSKLVFGPAGTTVGFAESEFGKDNLKMPFYLKKIGLNAFEVQFTFGVNLSIERAKILSKNAEENEIKLSCHAPYYCVLTSLKKDTVKKSKERLLQAFEVSRVLKCNTIVFHPGFYSGNPMRAREQFVKEMKEVVEKAKLFKEKNIKFGLEITGKKSALGSLEDVIFFCQKIDLCKPVLDLAHYHARTDGKLKTEKNFFEVFEKIEKELGKSFLQDMNFHFYPIVFGPKGEKFHTDFLHKNFEPDYRIFLKAVKEFGLSGSIICESAGRQDLDAVLMKNYWEKIQ